VIFWAIYRPADISNFSRFLLQTIWRTIFPYRIGNRQKKRYRPISRPTRPIFKTGTVGRGSARDFVRSQLLGVASDPSHLDFFLRSLLSCEATMDYPW